MSETTIAAFESPWMTRAEAAAYLRVGERTIDRYAEGEKPKLRKHRVEGVQSVRFKRAEVEALVSPEPVAE
jgi:excisionase family DNA binding protein